MKTFQIISLLLIICSVQQSQALGEGITDEDILNLLSAVDEASNVLLIDLAIQDEAVYQADEAVFYYLNTVDILNHLDEASTQQFTELLNELANEQSYSPEAQVTVDEIVLFLSNLANSTDDQNLKQILETAKDEAQIVDQSIIKVIQVNQALINDFIVTINATQEALNQTIYVANQSLNSFVQNHNKVNLDEAVLAVLDENFFQMIANLKNSSQISFESSDTLQYAYELYSLLIILTSNQNIKVVQLADDPQNLSIALQVDKVLIEANQQASQIYYLISAINVLDNQLKFLIYGDYLFGTGIYFWHYDEQNYEESEENYEDEESEENYDDDESAQGQTSDEQNAQVQNQSVQTQSASSTQGSDEQQAQNQSAQGQDEQQSLQNVQGQNQTAQNQSPPGIQGSDEQQQSQNGGNSMSDEQQQQQSQNDVNQSEQVIQGQDQQQLNGANQTVQNQTADSGENEQQGQRLLWLQ